MKRKILFVIPLLLILTGLLGPAIYAKKISKSNAPPVVSGEVTAPSAPGGNSSSGSTGGSLTIETTASPQPSSETSRAGKVQKEGEGLAGPGSSPVPEKGSPPIPAAAPGNEAVTVNIAVVGKNGEILFGPAAVQVTKKNRWDDTALGALDATGLPYDMSTGWSGFVEAIAGQRNKGQAGWMYKVNGEIPMAAADKKPVTTGDKVIWWYSKSMDTPSPGWDQLAKNN